MEIKRNTNEQTIQLLQQSLAAHLGGIPALLWRIDIARNEITFLNEQAISGLEGSMHLLLQNIGYARKIVLKEDRDRFFQGLDRIRNRQSCNTLFRIRNDEGMIRWLVCLGMAEPQIDFGYMGLVADCTDLVDTARNIECDGGLPAKLELFDTPVLLARFTDKQIVSANTAAKTYLGTDLLQTTLIDLLDKGSKTYLDNIYEQLIFSDYWSGLLPLALPDGQVAACSTRIRAYARGGKNLLWISLRPPQTDADSAVSPQVCPPDVLPTEPLNRLSDATTARQLLEVLLDSQPDHLADAIMLSRIFQDDNRIMVTGVGAPFLSVEEDDTHPYEGSIAENLVRFGLDQIIVEETSKSIKPIDWVLFIPRGINSYYAKPFFSRGKLRYVLIFCSRQPGRFTKDNTRQYACFFEPFAKALCTLFDSED
jgi:hypothetical protein